MSSGNGYLLASGKIVVLATRADGSEDRTSYDIAQLGYGHANQRSSARAAMLRSSGDYTSVDVWVDSVSGDMCKSGGYRPDMAH